MATRNPLLLEIPMPIITPQLAIRPYRETDCAGLVDAINESITELKQWMPWAQEEILSDLVEFEKVFIRRAMAQWALREDLFMIIVDNQNDEKIYGTIGLKAINWDVPKMEIGYWLRTSMTGKGLMMEAVNALTRYSFKQLNAQRVEIRCDEKNIKSRAIPERLGFVQEGILKNFERSADVVKLNNIVIYARYDAENLPEINVRW